ncbi:hypothetical protein HY409_00920 [Candidatus Gottesmanbacteria bacterium]|nr:hypothetical protein [Candidatus Gottesmanbacteria bacterium]
MLKLLLTKLGFSDAKVGVKGYISSLFGQEKKVYTSPLREERERFESDAKDQLLKLKEKGLSIPVFTL